MDTVKIGVSALVGAIGGFVLGKLLGPKEEDKYVLLKVWSAEHPDQTILEIPLSPKGGRWIGGTPCSDGAWTVEWISKEEYLRRRKDLWRKHYMESEGVQEAKEAEA